MSQSPSREAETNDRAPEESAQQQQQQQQEDVKPKKKMQITVTGHNGQKITFMVTSKTKLSKVKQSFAERAGFSLNEFRLLFDGRQVGTDDQTIEDQDIQEGWVI